MLKLVRTRLKISRPLNDELLMEITRSVIVKEKILRKNGNRDGRKQNKSELIGINSKCRAISDAIYSVLCS